MSFNVMVIGFFFTVTVTGTSVSFWYFAVSVGINAAVALSLCVPALRISSDVGVVSFQVPSTLVSTGV